MPMTKFSRGNFLHAIGNRAVRQAIAAFGLKASTAYETGAAAGTAGVNIVTTSTVLINAPNLSVDVAGGGLTYQIKGTLYVTTPVGAGIKLDLAGGQAAIQTGLMGGVFTFLSAAAIANSANQTALNTGGGVTALVTSVLIDCCATFSEPGQVILRFAQNASSGSTIILPNSYLTAIPLDHTPESA